MMTVMTAIRIIMRNNNTGTIVAKMTMMVRSREYLLLFSWLSLLMEITAVLMAMAILPILSMLNEG